MLQTPPIRLVSDDVIPLFITPIEVMVSDTGTINNHIIWDRASITRCNTHYMSYQINKLQNFSQARVNLQEAVQEFLNINESILFNHPQATAQVIAMATTLVAEIGYVKDNFGTIQFNDIETKSLASALLACNSKNLSGLLDLARKAVPIQNTPSSSKWLNLVKQNPGYCMLGGMVLGGIIYFGISREVIGSDKITNAQELVLVPMCLGLGAYVGHSLCLKAEDYTKRLELKKIYTANQTILIRGLAKLEEEYQVQLTQHQQAKTI